MLEYPKVLICGQYFHLKSGSGITLSNLFHGWNKNNIAVVTSFIVNPSYEVCENYYQLGSSEFKIRFPFNLNTKHTIIRSGKITGNANPESVDININNKKSLIRTIYDKILFSAGLIHYKNKFRISDEFLKWIKDFSPDIIYSQLSSLEEIRIVSTLQKELKLPLAIHIMDDWPSTICERYFPKLIWRKIINRELLRLLKQAKALLSISEPMSAEYQKRFGLTFIPFHNPIDTRLWLPHSKTTFSLNEKHITILYSGRIGVGISHSLLEFAEAIDSMNEEGLNIKLHIQTAVNERDILQQLLSYQCVVVNPVADYSQIPSIFSESDILLLANDFDKQAVTFLKFSMPTKASEYMISGTPVIVYSPKETAVTQFFNQHHCGYCVTRQGKEEIKKALRFLISDEEYRQKISRNAVKFAIEKFDAEKVRKEFKIVLVEAANRNYVLC